MAKDYGFCSLRQLIPLVTLTVIQIPVCHSQPWKPEIPPWGPLFENSVVKRTVYGDVKGFSVPWHYEDTYDTERTDGPPMWYRRRINCFLGIPYAEPPLGILRFREPRRPKWRDVQAYPSHYFRPACPQRIDEIQKDIPTFPPQNVSEDCLYLNIFAPNITWHPPDQLYPVMVYIHGGDYTTGTAQQYPGHVLATKEVVVVTFNYRLGALGFLSTEDEYGAGNWGLHDQHLALEFVKLNIRAFSGDPDQITLFGEGSGAANVGLHLLSPKSRGRGFYHQAIMMSGVDTSPFGSIDPYWRPRDYARNFSRLMGCDHDDTWVMVECLRDNKTKKWQDMLDMQEQIKPRDGPLGMVWGPVQDGGYHHVWPFLPLTPLDMRLQFNFESIPTMVGLNTNDGAKIANETALALERGMYKAAFREKIDRWLTDLRVLPHYHSRVADAVEFQYTWWPDPSNNSARTQEYVNMLTDMRYGTWIDQTVKQTCEEQPTYMYVFNYRSWEDWRPKWTGISYSTIIQYVFGHPFFNETVLNETEIVSRQWYDYLDRNISDFMLDMWTNFAKYGNPTPNITRNVTWQPFNTYNLSFLIVEEYSYLSWRYRQPKFGFWKEYFPLIAMRDYLFPTPTPTPADFAYVLATSSISAILFVLLTILVVCAYYLYYQTKMQNEEDKLDGRDMTYMNTGAMSSGMKTPTSTIQTDFTSGRLSPSYDFDYKGSDHESSRGSKGSRNSGIEGAGALGIGDIDISRPAPPYSYKGGRPETYDPGSYANPQSYDPMDVEPARPRVPYSYKGGRPEYKPDYLPRPAPPYRPVDYGAGYDTASTLATERSHPYSQRYVPSDPSFGTRGDPDTDTDTHSQSELIGPEPPRRLPYSYRGGRPVQQPDRGRTPPYLMELGDFSRRTPTFSDA